ncbi:MAG TPA: cell division protein ZapA [Nitrospirales bacterium]
MSQAFDIEVYGHRYTIRGDGEESYVQELARLVDERMRTLAAHMKNATPMQLAVLTAINLANELNQAFKQNEEQADDLNRRAEGLIDSIQESLGGSH